MERGINMELDTLANEFYQAYKTEEQIDLLIDRENPISVAEAYQVQNKLTELKKTQNNEEVVGFKISMTSEEMQRVVGKSNEPAYGTFTSNNLVQRNVTLQPNSPFLLEPELVFVLQEDLSPEADLEEVVKKSKIAAGLEIPSSRYKHWFPFNEEVKLVDIIADNAFAGGMLLGEAINIPSSIDWTNIQVHLTFNEERLATGYSEEVLGNPLKAVLWLNEKRVSQGFTLNKGTVISSGTFTDPVPLKAGTYKAAFDILGDISLEVQD